MRRIRLTITALVFLGMLMAASTSTSHGVELYHESMPATSTDISVRSADALGTGKNVVCSIVIRATTPSPLAADNALEQAMVFLVVPETAEVDYERIRVYETADSSGDGYVVYEPESQSSRQWFELLEIVFSQLPYVGRASLLGSFSDRQVDDPSALVDLNACDLVAASWTSPRFKLARNVKIDVPVVFCEETDLGLHAYWQSKANSEYWDGPTHYRDNSCSASFSIVAVGERSGPDETGIGDVVLVPASTFTMGAAGSYPPHCHVEHQVTLTHDFCLSQHEVTNQEYMKMLQWAYDHGYVTVEGDWSVEDGLDGSPHVQLMALCALSEIEFDSSSGKFYLRESSSEWAQGAYPEGYNPANHPVIEVTWHGAARYCDWLSLKEGLPRAYQHSGNWSCNEGNPYGASGYRLPTDAEWEYAAQYRDDRICPWGNEPADCGRVNSYIYTWPNEPPARARFNDYFCVGWTSPVGSYPDAPALLRLSDMAGNVWEWCNDWHECDLGTDPVTDPVGPPTGQHRLIRGGSWQCNNQGDGSELRAASRNGRLPNGRAEDVGFRVARTTDP